MNEYEFVALYHPDLEIDLEKPMQKVEKILSANGGKINKTDNWGKRKLAYPIKKQDNAVYVYYEVELPAESIAKIESTLNITDEVLRYLIAKPGPVPTAVESTQADTKTDEDSEANSPAGEQAPKPKEDKEA